MSKHSLQCKDLSVRIGDLKICDKLDLSLEPGMSVAVLGPNGAGKTTLLHTLAGLRKPTLGEVLLNGRDINAWSPRARALALGILFQDSELPLHGNVMQVALAGRHPHLRPFSLESADDISIVESALASTGLEDKTTQSVASLSGGERKRLALATLIAQDTPIRFFDEPTSHLDLRYQITALDLVNQHVSSAGGLALTVLHDVNLALRFCSHALMLFGDGQHLFDTSKQCITRDNLLRLYHYPMQEIEAGDRRWFVPE